MNSILGIFAKEPRAGEVKSRLAAVIGNEPAARLYDAFLRDLVARLPAIAATCVLEYTPATAHAYFAELCGGRFELEPQAAGDLGDRMAAFFGRRFAAGAQRVVLIGSDSPDLPLDRIERAFALLADHDVVIGPSHDGGYYLIGLRRLIDELFRNIAWSTHKVFARTMERIRPLGVTHAILDAWYDVDLPDDLNRLRAEIETARNAGRDSGVRHTEAVLRRIMPSMFD